MDATEFESICPNCGEELQDEWVFCPFCGISLTETDETLAETRDEYAQVGRLSNYAVYFKQAQEILEEDGDLEEALIHCEAALEIKPDSAEAHNLRGLILDLIGNRGEAIQSYREAVRLDPNFEDARQNLAEADAEQRGQSFQLVGADDPEQRKFGWWKLILLALVILILTGIFLKSGELINSIGSLIGPTTVLTFEPDRSKITDVDKAILEETAQILTERCDFMGCKGVKFNVSGDGQIVGKIPAYLNVDVETLKQKISVAGLIEFTDFGTTPIAVGTTIITDFEHPFFPKADLADAHHTIMTNAEIESANLSQDQLGQYLINFTLTEKGAKIFAEYTSKNIGSYLGIVIDKVILSVPIVNSAITSGEGVIEGNFTEESARNLAAYLHIRPLPIPLVLVEVGK
ncbi:MAG: SecDF P1 head subdomain-containing protein [Chloroflexota bacterium]